MLIATVAAALLSIPAAATDPSAMPSSADLPVAAFSDRPHMTDVDLSPDGSHIAYLIPVDGRQHLVVRKLPVSRGEKPAVLGPSDVEIVGFDWVSDSRLLVTVLATENVRTQQGRRPLRFSRLVSVSRDLTDMRVLLQRKPDGHNYYVQQTPVLHYVNDEHVLVAYPTDDDPWPGVVKLNVVTGKYARVRNGIRNVMSYLPDPTGEIRIARQYFDNNQETRYLRREAGESFVEMRRQDQQARTGFDVLGFDSTGRNLYVASRHGGDRWGIYTYNLDTDQMGEKVADDPRYDVRSVIVQRGAVVAFSWTDDLPQRRWLDPGQQALQEALDKAVPDSREVIIDTSADGKLVLAASYSFSAPTIYRLFDRRTGQFGIIGDTYPALPQELIAVRQPVTFKARDGQDIPGYLTLPVGAEGRNLPFILMPHGGPFARDDGDFDVKSQFLASRGYGVFQPNFRGSTGYGAAFNKAGGRQWGGLMQDDVTDAANWVVAQGYADPSRMCIVGWSYGGYAALMGAIKTPGLFKCVVATAPVTDLVRAYTDASHKLSANMIRSMHFGNDTNALRAISPVDNTDKVNVPVLLVHGDLDYQAPVAHSRDMERALKQAGKPVEYLEIKGMDHSPLKTGEMETILSAWERFLKAHIGEGTPKG